MLNPIDPEKIKCRTLKPERYLDEIELDWLRPLVEGYYSETVHVRYMLINRRWWKQDHYTEK